MTPEMLRLAKLSLGETHSPVLGPCGKLLAFESEHGKLGELNYRECGYFVFDEQGNIDQQNQWNQVRLSQASEGDPNSFAARRAKQIRQVNTWHPSGEQLGQMISLVKKRR